MEELLRESFFVSDREHFTYESALGPPEYQGTACIFAAKLRSVPLWFFLVSILSGYIQRYFRKDLGGADDGFVREFLGQAFRIMSFFVSCEKLTLL